MTYYPKNGNDDRIRDAALERGLAINAMLDLIVSNYFDVPTVSKNPELEERIDGLADDVAKMKAALEKAGVKF